MIIEHRDHMRVDDRLIVSWRPAKNTDLQVDELREVMLVSVNREINDMLASLNESAPDVAKLMIHLNHKLDLLTEEKTPGLYGPSLVQTNLSRTGIGFEWRADIDPGSLIRLTITLPPDNEKTTIRAQVLACDTFPDTGRARVRCRFLPDQDNKIAAISRYIEHFQATIAARAEMRAPTASEKVDIPASPAAEDRGNVLRYR